MKRNQHNICAGDRVELLVEPYSWAADLIGVHGSVEVIDSSTNYLFRVRLDDGRLAFYPVNGVRKLSILELLAEAARD